MMAIQTITLLAKAASGGSAGWGTLYLLLSSAGVTAIIGAVVTALINRRKMGAETVDIASQTQRRIIEDVNKENERLLAQADVLRKRIADLELIAVKADADKWDMRAQIDQHYMYDQMLIDKLRAHGETDIPPPPRIIVT